MALNSLYSLALFLDLTIGIIACIEVVLAKMVWNSTLRNHCAASSSASLPPIGNFSRISSTITSTKPAESRIFRIRYGSAKPNCPECPVAGPRNLDELKLQHSMGSRWTGFARAIASIGRRRDRRAGASVSSSRTPPRDPRRTSTRTAKP